MRALLDDGPFLARDAAADGLIDALGYEDQAVTDMQTRLKETELKKVSSRAYLKAALGSAGSGRRIALVGGERRRSRRAPATRPRTTKASPPPDSSNC